MADTALQDASPEDSTDPAEMDLDWLTLEDGESIQWASTPHRYSIVPAFLVGIPLSIVLVGIPILVASYLQYTNTNYVVTNRGLYSKRGVLSRDVQQIGFDKIQNISYSQSALGSSFGYGSVDISTAGGAGIELQFRSIPDPASVQELIAREVDTRQKGEGDSEKEDVLDEILVELRAIRQAVAEGDDAHRETDAVPDETPSKTGAVDADE
ncbi:PH domain-containing protein [Halorubrum sp. 2020YC2]|uniref:PH domain-containing protein n=1 Tax=Halorubrum sp. 2020YC2 TaxID=2836432 RepID=UPI001BEC7F06|nr:PH domain-containing protein [Halorubrum sp. 2020YC2]QWC18458.1 PH domain-containing protein [Halorubrum sp. 2020YC2]